jgi:PAS domain S-box-containing protein
MTIALLAGFGPGLLATLLSGLLVEYWVLEPIGQFSVASPADRLGLVLFMVMGVFMSAVAGLYRRTRDKAEAYDRELALGASRREQLFLAQVLELSSQPFAIGYLDGRLGLFNHAFEQLTGYSGEELRAFDWSVQLTPPEWKELERRHLEELHRTGRRGHADIVANARAFGGHRAGWPGRAGPGGRLPA